MANPTYPTSVQRSHCRLEIIWTPAGTPVVTMYAAVTPNNGRDNPAITATGVLSLSGGETTSLNNFIDGKLAAAATALGLG